jgi:non-specific protein-tyrosine kinase
MTPLYQSTAVVQVAIRTGNNQADYNNLLASDQLVQTEAQLATSDPVLREVASRQKGATVDQLLKDVSSTPEVNTQLFQITVLDPNPDQAAGLANDIAATLIKQQLQVVQQDNGRSQQQIQQDLNTTQQQIDLTSSKISALQAKRGAQAQIVMLQSQLSGLQQHYSQWQTVLAQLELTEAESGSFLRIAQAAQPGLSPVRPNVLLYTSAGLVTGLFLGILLAILFEQLDTRVRTPEALIQLLGWSVVGTIWRTQASKDGAHDRAEMINPQGHDANVESYRILRTNIGFSGIDKPLHSLMVTSAMPGDGKSTVAANLAIFMAKAGKNTLLVDADLRRPVQHQIFNLSADKKGLSNAVLSFSMPGVANSPQLVPLNSSVPSSGSRAPNTSDSFLEPFMHAVGIPNLRVMSSGPLPPNPSELLDSKAMQRLFTIFAGCGAEVVIFDAPPIRGLSDANILASKVDGTLVVVDVSRANKGHLKQVKTLLTQAGANVLGCVVNKQRRSRDDSSYSYYYYYRQDDQGAEGQHKAKDKNAGLAPTLASINPANGFDAAKKAVKGAFLETRTGGRGRNER